MEKNIGPKSIAGKWSVGLCIFFVVEMVSTIVIFAGILKLSFDDVWHGVHWWGRVVVTAFPASIISLITGIAAWRKNKDNSIMVRLSVIIGLGVLLFLMFHPLFIND